MQIRCKYWQTFAIRGIPEAAILDLLGGLCGSWHGKKEKVEKLKNNYRLFCKKVGRIFMQPEIWKIRKLKSRAALFFLSRISILFSFFIKANRSDLSNLLFLFKIFRYFKTKKCKVEFSILRDPKIWGGGRTNFWSVVIRNSWPWRSRIPASGIPLLFTSKHELQRYETIWWIL